MRTHVRSRGIRVRIQGTAGRKIDPMKATLAIDAKDKIGEQPVWDSAHKRLVWCDNAIGVIHEARLEGTSDWRESRRWTLGRHIGAAIPRARGGFIVVAGTDILMLNEAGDIAPFARLDADPLLVGLNDAKCDPQGRLWAGTLCNDLITSTSGVTTGRGALYRIDPDGTVTTILKNVTLSNGLDWSPDGSTFYYIDSHSLSVDAFDFDPEHGTISNRRTVVTIKRGEGMPDGMTVDSEGCLWVAVLGAGEIRRYAPSGTQLSHIEVSAPAVTSCAFGGPDGADLFITSACVRLPHATMTIYGFSAEVVENSSTAPGAGGLFTCRPNVKGKPATLFAG